MQTSRFQLGLIATLAVGLGFSLASSDAVGYPAGAAVSMGANPIWSKGGAVGTLPGEAVITAPVGSDVIVTDVVLSYRDSNCYPTVYLSNGAGEELARFAFFLNMDSDKAHQPTNIQHAFKSGVPLDSGDTLTISQSASCSTLSYTLSGYYAQP